MTHLHANSIDHLNMNVKNLDESVEFYSKLFGFTTLKEQPEEDSRIIGNEHIKLCLYETDGVDGSTGISHFGIHVSNFSEIENKCKEIKIRTKYDAPLEWEKSRSIYIYDPSGYVIELTEVQGGGL